MARIIIWGGHHSKEIQQLIGEVYHSPDDLLILCPPRIKDITDWLAFLPTGRVEFAGELSGKGFEHSSKTHFPETPKFGLFNSGTEDSTKLILYTNRNFESSNRGIFSFFKHLPITNIYCYPQPYHVFGLSLGYLASLMLNKELFTPSGKYSRDHHEVWHSVCQSHGAHLLTLGTPTHFLDSLKLSYDTNHAPAPSLTAIVGGAKVEKNLWHLMQNNLHIAHPSIGYGCSEASPGVTQLRPGLTPRNDDDIGEVLPNGLLTSEGETFSFQGDNVCLAIIQDQQVILPRGSYQLIDSLHKELNGHYFYKQRTGLVLDRGGEKFSLEEIEAALYNSLNLKCVALAVSDQRLGQELALVYEGSDDKKRSIQLKLSELFKRNFNPAFLMAVDKLPITANAKYDRSQCLVLMKARTIQ